jgi:hypothetical protein
MKRICALLFVLTLTITATACSKDVTSRANPDIGLTIADISGEQTLYGEWLTIGIPAPVKAAFVDNYWFFLGSDRKIYRINADFSDSRELISLPSDADAPQLLHVYNGYVWVADEACVVYKMNYDGGNMKMLNLVQLLSLPEQTEKPNAVRSLRSDADGTLYIDMFPSNRVYTIYADLTHDAPEAGNSVKGLVVSGDGDYISVKTSEQSGNQLFDLTANAAIAKFSTEPRLFDGDGNYDIYYLDGDSLYGVLADRNAAERVADFADVDITALSTKGISGANITDVLTYKGELFLCVSNVGLVQLKAKRG